MAQPQKFEYKVMYLGSGDPASQEKMLDEYGALGWELIVARMDFQKPHIYSLIFKRPL